MYLIFNSRRKELELRNSFRNRGRQCNEGRQRRQPMVWRLRSGTVFGRAAANYADFRS